MRGEGLHIDKSLLGDSHPIPGPGRGLSSLEVLWCSYSQALPEAVSPSPWQKYSSFSRPPAADCSEDKIQANLTNFSTEQVRRFCVGTFIWVGTKPEKYGVQTRGVDNQCSSSQLGLERSPGWSLGF